jgi:phosphoserine phosphatase RsbU/P
MGRKNPLGILSKSVIALSHSPEGFDLLSPVYRSGPKWGRPQICALMVCLSLAYSALGAHSQGFDATTLRQPIDLAAGWLVHAGDDPSYARPDFDDSNWPSFNAGTGSLHTIFPNSRPQVVWYRLHIKLAPDEHNLSLHTTAMPGAWEIYVNGTRLAGAGKFSPYVPYDASGHLLIPIPDSDLRSGSLLVALRIHIDRIQWSLPQPGYQSYNLTFGQMEGMREHMWYWIAGSKALEWVDDLVTVGMMFGALLLYSTQRNRREYLWLFLWTAVGVPSTLLWLYSLRHTFPLRWHIVDVLYGLVPYLMARTYCAFVGHRIGWKLNLFLIVAGLARVYAYWKVLFGVQTFSDNMIYVAPIALLELVILPWILIADIRRGRRETAFLLFPLMLSGVWAAGYTIAVTLIQVPGLRDLAFHFAQHWEAARFGSFYVTYSTVADILSVFSLALIILIRSNRMSRQQAVLESEIANAREVQQVILPEAAVESIPGFHIESIYEPAQEVGGDFFQIVPVSNERLILVVGDVAGKGLPAAMLVSVLVGAIRSIADFRSSPDEILTHLNQRMIGRTNGGFSTALAALFTADGSVSIANAGHLPPYLDGREVELPGALPLGIDRGATYEATKLQLEPGSRLTFYSDGVIEARDKSGQLFGFERGREVSIRPAKAIVEAAKTFGQMDDITVVTVERFAVEERHKVIQTSPVCTPA